MIAAAYSNPYTGLSFFETLWLVIYRLVRGVMGQTEATLYADELQMLVLAAVAVSSALVGSFLILRRMAMLANALSHTILLGIVVAFMASRDFSHFNIGALVSAALVMGLVTTFLTQFLTQTTRLQEDASIGVVFTALFSLGIIAVTLFTRNAHVGTEVVMGNVDALHHDDLLLTAGIFVANLVLIGLLYKEYLITTFDAGLAVSLGISATLFDYLLMMQTAATAVGAFRAVGVVMVLAFLVGPPLIARMLTDRLVPMLMISSTTGIVASVSGVALSRHILSVYGVALTTAGVTVTVIVVLFVAGVTYKVIRKRRQIASVSKQISPVS